MKVLAFAEQRDGKLKTSALETLSVAAKLNSNASEVAAVLIGSGVEGLATELKDHGADTCFVVDAEALKTYNCLSYAAALEAVIKQFSPDAIVGSASPMGRDLFPRLAARLDAGLITDVTSLEASGDQLTANKPMYAGKVIATIATEGSGAKMVTIRPNVFGAASTGSGAAAVTKVDAALPDTSALVTKEIRKGASEKKDLTESNIIISGGRAMANAENFKILQDCADVVGATVGASRAAVDSGYATHDMQVGQTGKTVNPNLYIACGISGSIQHMAGMRTSKVIVAVNTDPEAPIFGIADYGIVADLFKAVPAMTEKFKAKM